MAISNFCINCDKYPADYCVIFYGSEVISVFNFVVDTCTLSKQLGFIMSNSMKEWKFDFREMSLPKDKVQEFLYQHGYYFALFDVLGFESRIHNPSIGLDGMYHLYKRLISITKETNEFAQRMFKSGITDAFAFDGGVAIYYPVFSAYASDTIILWADRTAIAAKLAAISDGDVHSFKDTRELAWAAKPVPPDPFLKVCCELLCKSIEIGLPLRGALTIGDLIMKLTTEFQATKKP